MNYKSSKIISKKDADKVAEIISFSLDNGDFPYKTETRTAYKKIYDKKFFRNFITVKKNIVFGAYQNNNLIGFIALKPEDGGVLFVEWFIVAKEYRGQGIGSMLLEKMEKWALNNKIHYIYLYTETETNKIFYKSKGFKYIGTHEKAWFGETEYLFGKHLVV